MSDKERAQKSKNHENQDILSTKTKSPDTTIDMDITKDSKREVSNNTFIDQTNILAQKAQDGVNSTNLDIDNTKDANNDLQKQNIQDINDNNKKPLENTTYITMTIYDTYYEEQQPKEQPHRQSQLERPSLHQHSLDDRGGGYYTGEAFTYERGSRSSFIRLVFTILLLMILATSGFIFFVIQTDNVKAIFRKHYLIFFIAGFALVLISHCAIYCSQCSRTVPCNIFVLILTVIAYGIVTANLSARYKTHLILYAALATTAVVFVCLLLACTSFDFTSWILYIIAIMTVFAVIAALVFLGRIVIGEYPKPLHIGLLIVGSLLQVVMLIVELQAILGGKTVELHESDYALGAYMLYSTIASIFMYLLQLFGLMDV